MKSFLLFLIASINLFLGLVIFIKGRKRKYNIYYFFVVISLFFWSFGVGMFYYNTSIYIYDIFFTKLLYFFGSLIPTSFLGFALSFPKDTKINSKKSILLFLPNIILFYLIFLTDSIINNIYIDVYKSIEYGHFLFLFNIEFIFILLIAYLILLKKYFLFRDKDVLLKKQLQYIMVGTLISAVIGSFCNVILPIFGNFSVFWVGPVSTIFMVSLFTYAIAKYRLMDIRLVISKSVLYFFLIFFVTMSFTSVTFLTGEVFAMVGVPKVLVTIIISIVIVLTLDPLKRFLGRITDKVFYHGKIDYQDVLRKLGKIIAKEIDLKKLLIDLSKNIERLLKYKKVDFLYKNSSSGIYRGLLNDNLVFSQQDDVIKYLEDEKNIVIVEELKMKLHEKSLSEKKYLSFIVKRLEKMHIGLIAPVISESKIIAFLIVDKKLSGDIFSNEDLNLISVITPQIANSLEKAKLYKEVQEFNVKLQERVEQATEKLKNANLDLETRNKYLTALQKISSTISRSLDFNEVVKYIANSIRSELGFAAGIIDFIDQNTQSIYIGAMTQNKLVEKALAVVPKDPFAYQVSLKNEENQTVRAINHDQILKTDKLHALLTPALSSKLSAIIQKILNIRSIVSVPVYSENKIIGAIDFFIRKPTKEIKNVDIEVMKSLADQTGLVIGNLKLYQQIKEKNIALKQANVHLKKLDKAKSEFLSIASHQLRTPLTGIKGYLSMLLEGDYGKIDKKQTKIIQDVYNASDRMSRLINVFLNVSRIESGRLKLDYTRFDLSDLIKECIKDLESTAQEKGLKLIFDVQKNKISKINADRDKMKDVLLNLIDNAIKYTHQGKIEIKLLKQDEQEILVKIKDTGIGLDQEGIDKLFNKFSRGEGISKINTSGSGLGLYIVRRIIEEHKGKVWVESDGPGKGSTFQFLLPIDKV